MAANEVDTGKVLNNGLKKYTNGFSEDEILNHNHMNFIASNINAIINALTWNEDKT